MKRLLILIILAAACSGESGISGGQDAGVVEDSGSSGDDSGAGTVDSGANNVSNNDAGAPDMAPPVELEHTLYAVEVSGKVHWFDLQNPGSPAASGMVDVGGRVTYGAFAPDTERFYLTNEMRVEGYALDQLQPTSIGSGSMSVGGTALDVTLGREAVVTASYGGDTIVANPLVDGVPQDSSQELGGASSGFCDRAHQVRVHPGTGSIYVPCLVNDHIRVLTWESGELRDQGAVDTAGGMGPRHLDFHPTLDVLYVLGERNSTVEVFDMGAQPQDLTRRQTVSTMADGQGASASSDVHVSADGRFLYAMNRQPVYDLAVFEIDQATGELTRVQNVDSGGEHARTFALHPDGTHLYAGHSDTRDVTIFTLDDLGRATLSATKLGPFDSAVWFVGVYSRPKAD